MRLLVGATVAAIVASTWPAAAEEAPCAGAPAGGSAIVVVVDFGDLPGAPDEPSVACVPVPRDADGNDVLAARSELLGTPPPRYHASGLLCAIDGLPAEGCGERTADGYSYWSYWQGAGDEWTYASLGPGGRHVEAAAVEGWRFVDGAGRPEDPAPRLLPAAAAAAAADASDGLGAARREDGSPTSPAGSSTGAAGPAGLAVGGALVVFLVAAATVTARRRSDR